MLHHVFADQWEKNKAKEPPNSPNSCTCTDWSEIRCVCKGNCTCHYVWCGQREDCSTCFHSEEQKYSEKDVARLCHKWDKDVLNTDRCEDWLRKPHPMRRS